MIFNIKKIDNKYLFYIECKSCKIEMRPKYFLSIIRNNPMIVNQEICESCLRDKKIINIIKWKKKSV